MCISTILKLVPVIPITLDSWQIVKSGTINLSTLSEATSKAAKATMHEGYNNKNIPVSAYYNVNSTGRFGSRYVGD